MRLNTHLMRMTIQTAGVTQIAHQTNASSPLNAFSCIADLNLIQLLCSGK